MKYFITAIVMIMLLISCGRKKPESDWTAEEYFRYAKEIYDDEDYLEAISELTVVTLRYPGSSVTDSAQFYLGMSHYHMDEHIISAAEFNKLINDLPESPLVPEAQYMLGESYYAMSPRPELDQEYTAKAIKEYQIFLEDYPTHKRREEVEKKILELREKLAEKQFRNADSYRKRREFKSSLIYYDIVLERYYDSEYADDAMYGKAKVFIEQEEYQKARELLIEFKNKFADSDLIEDVDETIKDINSEEKKDDNSLFFNLF